MRRSATEQHLRALPGGPRVDLTAAEAAAGDLLVALGADLSDEGLRETPRRIAKAYSELLTPTPFNPTTFPNDEGYDELVVVRGIPFQSLCMHHLLPFQGSADVAYLPGTGSSASEARPRRRPVRARPAGTGAADDAGRRLARGGAGAPRRRRRSRGGAPVHVDARRPEGWFADGHVCAARARQGRPAHAPGVPQPDRLLTALGLLLPDHR